MNLNQLRRTTRTSLVRLVVAGVAALAIPTAVAATADAAIITGASGTLRPVYGYGSAHCNPAYTTYIEIDAPFVARTPPSGAGVVGGGQPVFWQPWLDKYTATGWKRVWTGPLYSPSNYSSTEAGFNSVWINTRLLTGGGSGYYRAGGGIGWGATSWAASGAFTYRLSEGNYLSGGGANAYLATRLSTPYCWLNA